ncbi:MAG: acyl-ACP--UDP-N-acetylglucosamine O-acyltransferase [Pseudomonadales bacterium]|nr:acyl-ACP--UDP-N-acetylglucosamine O-acyltransferase [Pseudomonadales bacterium]
MDRAGIHPTSIIDPSARIAQDVEIGPWSIVGPQVDISEGCRIASHVVLKGPTRIGKRNTILQFSSVGEDTPATAYAGESTGLLIGDDNIIREGVTIHRGMQQHNGETVVGNNNLFMAYVHIGHDCIIGDHVVMANNSAVSGHCTVGDYANIGGYAGIPQFRSIGAYTHIAGMSLVLKDIPAFVTAAGNPAYAVGMNTEGMKRRGLDKQVIEAMNKAYRIVYRKGLLVNEALDQLAPIAREILEVALFVDSIKNSQWGIVRSRSK